jgi:hypothetical protein
MTDDCEYDFGHYSDKITDTLQLNVQATFWAICFSIGVFAANLLLFKCLLKSYSFRLQMYVVLGQMTLLPFIYTTYVVLGQMTLLPFIYTTLEKITHVFCESSSTY